MLLWLDGSRIPVDPNPLVKVQAVNRHLIWSEGKLKSFKRKTQGKRWNYYRSNFRYVDEISPPKGKGPQKKMDHKNRHYFAAFFVWLNQNKIRQWERTWKPIQKMQGFFFFLHFSWGRLGRWKDVSWKLTFQWWMNGISVWTDKVRCSSILSRRLLCWRKGY